MNVELLQGSFMLCSESGKNDNFNGLFQLWEKVWNFSEPKKEKNPTITDVGKKLEQVRNQYAWVSSEQTQISDSVTLCACILLLLTVMNVSAVSHCI